MTSRRKPGPVERVLRKARGLIAKGWARGVFHVRRRGVDCYCAHGAISASVDADVSARELARDIMRCEANAAGYDSLFGFNDLQYTRKPVLALFDRAIAKAKEAGV